MLEIGGSGLGATASVEAGGAPPCSNQLRGRSSTGSTLGAVTLESEYAPSTLSRLPPRASCAGEWLTQLQPQVPRVAKHPTNLKRSSLLSLS